MTPQLSLSYSSNAGSGWIGEGWFIDGLSSIQRCPKTWAQDGAPRNVLLDLGDRYCLDGNRLRAVSGSHGGVGTEYRTEIETFTRVRSQGAAGNGPAYFTAEMKNGLIYEFGNTASSRIEAQGTTTVRSWMVNTIRDRDGNAILFEYTEEPTSGSYRLANVQYTSNPTQGLSPAYKIEFFYDPQPAGEIDVGYWAGRIIQDAVRLARVDVTYNQDLIRRYAVTYEPTLSSTSKSRVQSVQECAGSSGTDCVAATTFSYWDGSAGVDAQVSTGVAAATSRWITDVNGDGKDDIVYSTGASGSSTWMIMFSNGSGYAAPVNTGITNTNYTQAIKIDYNADGLGDMLVPYSGGTWWVLHGTTSGFSQPGNTGAPVTATGVGSNARALDVNGDGLQDLVWADLVGFSGGDAIRYRLRVWGQAFSSTVSDLVSALAADSMISSPVWGVVNASVRNEPDFNGDGRDDFLYRRVERVFIDGEPSFWQHTYYTVAVAPVAGAFTFMTTSANVPAIYGDFNGDGFTDIIYLSSATNSRVRFGTGAGFSADDPAPHNAQGTSVAYDWDGDGYEDLLSRNFSSGASSLLRYTGLSFSSAVATGISSSDSVMVSDINGDGLQDLTYPLGGIWHYRLHSGVRPDLLKSVTDGWGNVTTFFYTTPAQGSYTKDSGAPFPEQDYQGSLPVVNQVTVPNGIGGTYTRSYWYNGARTHLQGRGFEGFSIQRVQDSRNGIYAHQYFHRLFPLTGAVYRSRVFQADNTTAISDAEQSWEAQPYSPGSEGRVLPYVSGSTQRRYEVGGTYNAALISTTAVVNQLHAPTGTIYNSTTTVTEATTANGILANTSYVSQQYYQVDHLTNATGDEWCIGRPGMSQSINHHGDYGGVQVVRTTQLHWDTKCRLAGITDEPGNGELQVTRSLGHDQFGNVDSETVTGVNMAARVTIYNWGTTGQFPVWTTNALSHRTDIAWNYRYGVPSSLTDPNGISTSWEYDNFGRRNRENRPDDTYSTWAIESTSGDGGDPRTRYSVRAVSYTKFGEQIGQHYTFLDAFERAIGEYHGRFNDGGFDTIIRNYDAFGRLWQQSIPYVSSGRANYSVPSPTTYQYDLLGRLTQVDQPVSDSNPTLQTSRIFYEGLTTRVRDALDKQTSKTSNVLGALVRSASHDYAQIFAYDAFGNVVRVLDNSNNTLQSNDYNLRGMLRSQTDMDRGTWAFTPNALGELRYQLDANGIATTFEYDLLGRPLTRVAPDGGQNMWVTWTWGTSAAAKNIGRPEFIHMGGPTIADNRETYSYDSKGRLEQTVYTGGGVDYYVNRTYNEATGFLDTLTYPQSTSGYRLKLKYEYQAGRLLRVRDFNAQSPVFWQANAMDARGNVIDEQLGNGIQTIRGYDQVNGLLDSLLSGAGANGAIQDLTYKWDRVGNLTERKDLRQNGLTELFFYDDIYRLDYSRLNGAINLDMSYDAMGNIVSKTGVGGYAYHASKKHAVTHAGSNTFTYDANGNQITRNGHAVTWYPFNLPKHISAAGNNTSTFSYNMHGRRWSQNAVYDGVIENTIYIGGLMDIVTRNGVTAYRHYISGGTGTIAEYIRDSSGLAVTRYLTRDHLGSVDSITDSSGAAIVRMSYDAYGDGRNEAGWSGSVPIADMTDIAANTRRGFTEHDMLDNLQLIHMNGRVFDPVVGRFISADPFIDGAGNTQGWNRYSYVGNNPLSLVDPTGFIMTSAVRFRNDFRSGGMLGNAGMGGFSGFGSTGYATTSAGAWAYHAGVLQRVTTSAPRISKFIPGMPANLERELGLSQVSVSLGEYRGGDPSSGEDPMEEVIVSGRRGSTVGGNSIGGYLREFALGALDAFAQAGLNQSSPDGFPILFGEYKSPFPGPATNELQLARDLGPAGLVVGGLVAGKFMPGRLPDSALVCRGGLCTADRFANGSGVTVDAAGKLQTVSVQSAAGKTVEQLTIGVRNPKVGVTTVGDVRRAGGDVIPSPNPGNADHCTLCGITPRQAEQLFTPVIPNPNR